MPYPLLPLQLDLTVKDLQVGSRKVLAQLFPDWNPKEMKWVTYTQGLTNKLLKVTYKDQKVLVRVWGQDSEYLIDRKAELEVERLM